MARAPMREPISPMFRRIIAGVRPVMMACTKRDWSGGQYLPREGGFVIASNHVSWADPLAMAHFIVDNGRAPHFLTKSSLFDFPALKQVLEGTGQIPVYRNTTRAVDAFSAAVQAVADGACVVVLPEGTISRDPKLWPMTGKTGAARIALETGCPLIPAAMWGPEKILWPYRDKVPRVVPRKTMQIAAGPPVDLRDLQPPFDGPTLRTATDRLMHDITELLAGLRGETPPEKPFDPRHGGASGRSKA